MVGNSGGAFAAGFGISNVDLLYIGMPRMPLEGEEIYAKDFSLQLGGGYVATMINMGRLGIPTKIATFLGADMFSSFARAEMEKSGATPYNLYAGEKIPLNITAAALTPSDRTFISYNGYNEVTPEMREAFYTMCRGAKVVFAHPDFYEECLRLKAEGSILLYDMGWEDDLSEEKYGHILSLVDYYTPNSKEAMKLTGANTPEKAALAMTKWFPKAIVKTDKEGCIVVEEGELFRAPPLPGVRAVDATGAGDAFLAGFAYGLFHDRPFKECALLGNITGGACVQGIGCLSSYLEEEELLRLLAIIIE